MKRLHNSVDTLNKHERLLFLTHNVKIGVIVIFDSFTASSVVLAKTLFLLYRQENIPAHFVHLFKYNLNLAGI